MQQTHDAIKKNISWHSWHHYAWVPQMDQCECM